MELKEVVNLDFLKLDSSYRSASLSQRKRLEFDKLVFNDISNVSGLGVELRVNYKNLPFSLIYYIESKLEELDSISTSAIQAFKDVDFKCFHVDKYKKLSLKSKKEILGEFYRYFNSKYARIYNQMLDDNRIFSSGFDGNAGLAFPLPAIGSYYLGVALGEQNDLEALETIIHELSHIYSYMFLSNYRHNAIYNLNNSLYTETLPLYAELSFYDFLIRNRFFDTDMEFMRNNEDYLNLFWYKTIKYITTVGVRPNTQLYSNDVEYTMTGDIHLDIDEGIPFFRFPDEMAKGDLVNFKYAISLLEAYNMLEQERAGEKPEKISNEFLIKMQDEKYVHDMPVDYNYSFMKNEILTRQKRLEKIIQKK